MDYKYLINTGNFGALDEVYEIRILLCYLMRHVPRPLTHDQLVQVATKDDMINYFYLTDALEGMKAQELVTCQEHEDGKSYYKLTDKGAMIAAEFQRLIPRALRDKIVGAAVELFARMKRERELICEMTDLPGGGYEVHFKLMAVEDVLADIRLYAPEYAQAQRMRKNLCEDPSAFYMKLVGLALEGVEDGESSEKDSK